jgi:hypothetical protein
MEKDGNRKLGHGDGEVTESGEGLGPGEWNIINPDVYSWGTADHMLPGDCNTYQCMAGYRWTEEEMYEHVWSGRSFHFHNFLPKNLWLKVDLPEGFTFGMEYVVSASFAATFTIPEGTTTADLLADDAFTGALATGVANTLGVSVDDVLITDISEASRRKLVSEKRRLEGTALTVEYTVTMASESAAEAVATNIADNSESLGTTLQAEITEAIAADDSLSTSYAVSEVAVQEATVTSVDTTATTTTGAPTTTPAPTTTAAVANTTTVADSGDDDDDDSGDDAAPAAPAEESFAHISSTSSLSVLLAAVCGAMLTFA